MRLIVINKNGMETWMNITSFRWEYQPENGKTFWLFITFKKGSKEYQEFPQYHETAISIDPKKESFVILDV